MWGLKRRKGYSGGDARYEARGAVRGARGLKQSRILIITQTGVGFSQISAD